MKKQTLISLAFLAFFSMLTCLPTLARQFDVGDKDVNLMIGLGRIGTFTHSDGGLPPVSLSVDYGWRDDIGPGILSIGGYIGASTVKYDWAYYNPITGNTSDTWKYTYIVVAARGTYHYLLTDALDTYGGVMIGIENGSSSHSAYGSYTDGFFSTFIGAKYFFSDNIAVMGELGWGVAWLNIGVCVKL